MSSGRDTAQDLDFVEFPKTSVVGDNQPYDHVIRISGQVFQSL